MGGQRGCEITLDCRDFRWPWQQGHHGLWIPETEVPRLEAHRRCATPAAAEVNVDHGVLRLKQILKPRRRTFGNERDGRSDGLPRERQCDREPAPSRDGSSEKRQG